MTNSLRTLGWLALAVPLAVAACANLDRDDRGTLQPQTVSGPCDVKKFFLLNLTAVHTTMSVAGTGQACTITIINPDLQVVHHGRAGHDTPRCMARRTAGLLAGGAQASVSYTPQPGYAGPDRFTLTLEPHDRPWRWTWRCSPAAR